MPTLALDPPYFTFLEFYLMLSGVLAKAACCTAELWGKYTPKEFCQGGETLLYIVILCVCLNMLGVFCAVVKEG